MQADSFLSVVTDAFPDGKLATPPTPPGDFPRVRVQLPDSADYGVSLQALNPEDGNSVVNVLFQVQRDKFAFDCCDVVSCLGVFVCMYAQIGPVCDVSTEVCSMESLTSSVYLALLNQVISVSPKSLIVDLSQSEFTKFC